MLFGAEPVLEGVAGGGGFTLLGDGSTGFGAIDFGLLRLRQNDGSGQVMELGGLVFRLTGGAVVENGGVVALHGWDVLRPHYTRGGPSDGWLGWKSSCVLFRIRTFEQA